MSIVLKGILNGKSEICKSIEIQPLMITKDRRIIMICILAFSHRMSDFIQISFFEAIENDDNAFNLILNEAKEMGRRNGATKISGSLNIHVNYGLGFLASNYDSWQSFGSAHNPEFYNNLFIDNGFKTTEMVSLYRDIRNLPQIFTDRLVKILENRYNIRPIDFNKLEKEAEIYTKINNEAFKDHLFYYEREKLEDLELFKEFKYFLKPENLLFVERDSEPVGFILWYPDFHKIMSTKESIGVWTVIKNKFLNKNIRNFKIVEIGVIPSEQNKGAILALFNYLYKCTKDKYDSFESGWILKDNDKSLNLSLKLTDGISKTYKAYIKEI